MTGVRLAVTAAIVAGALIAVQSALIGAFGARMHPFVASTWVHAAGFVFGVIGVLVARLGFQVDVVRSAPWGLAAGICGVLLVTGIAVAIGGIGLASTLAIVTGVQLLVGFVLESSGITGPAIALDPARLVGAGLIVAGVYLMVSRGPA